MVLLAAVLAFSSPVAAQEPAQQICTCTCAVKNSKGEKIVLGTIDNAACSPCSSSCCDGLCGPVIQEKLAKRKKVKESAIEAPAPLKASPGPKDYAPLQEKVAKLIELTEPVVAQGEGDIKLADLAGALQLDALLEPEEKAKLAARGMLVVKDGAGSNEGEEVSGPVQLGSERLPLRIAKEVQGKVVPVKGGGFALKDVKGLEGKKGLWFALRELYILPDRVQIVTRFKTLEFYLAPEGKP